MMTKMRIMDKKINDNFEFNYDREFLKIMLVWSSSNNVVTFRDNYDCLQ